MTKECNPGVVSPPVAATWIVLTNQSNPSGLPCAPGAVMLVRLQGKAESFLLNAFQSPAKTILETPVTNCDCHRGAIIWASHCPYNWLKATTSPGWVCFKLWTSLISVDKLKSCVPPPWSTSLSESLRTACIGTCDPGGPEGPKLNQRQKSVLGGATCSRAR